MKPTMTDKNTQRVEAAMDAFYPGENWRVDLGSALEGSLRDMRAAISAADALTAPVPAQAAGVREDDPKWLSAQLRKLIAQGHVCACTLSGEFESIADGVCEACTTSALVEDEPRLSLSGVPMPPEGIEACAVCAVPFRPGDRVIYDVNEGEMHRDCVGDDRESFVDPETEEPIGPDEPLPTGYPWVPDATSAPVEAGGSEALAGDLRNEVAILRDERDEARGTAALNLAQLKQWRGRAERAETALTASAPVETGGGEALIGVGVPLTAIALADALECFWNAALGAQRADTSPVGYMAEGFQAVAVRLRESVAPVETGGDEALAQAVRGISDDFMTSEKHHPGYVLIPIAKFEQLRAVEALAAPRTAPAGGVGEVLAGWCPVEQFPPRTKALFGRWTMYGAVGQSDEHWNWEEASGTYHDYQGERFWNLDGRSFAGSPFYGKPPTHAWAIPAGPAAPTPARSHRAAQFSHPGNGQASEKSLEALKTERHELEFANAQATGWGAAVGARHERIQEIDREIARRG